jgi:hypothetical protein
MGVYQKDVIIFRLCNESKKIFNGANPRLPAMMIVEPTNVMLIDNRGKRWHFSDAQ